MSEKINLDVIIKNQTGFVSESNEHSYNMHDLKKCMTEFGKQLLELAAKNAKIKIEYEKDWLYGKLPIPTINKRSIINAINQIE